MELEVIQALLSDAMEMAQEADAVPPGVDPDMVATVSNILATWVLETLGANGEEQNYEEMQALITSATACAYLASKLEDMQDKAAGETISYNLEPTHPEGQHVTINFNFR